MVSIALRMGKGRPGESECSSHLSRGQLSRFAEQVGFQPEAQEDAFNQVSRDAETFCSVYPQCHSKRTDAQPSFPAVAAWGGTLSAALPLFFSYPCFTSLPANGMVGHSVAERGWNVAWPSAAFMGEHASLAAWRTMNSATINVIRSALQLDVSLTTAQKARILRLLTTPDDQTERKSSPEPDRFLRPREAADYVGLSKRTLARHIKSGRLNPHRLNGRVLRFRRSELDAFLAGA